MDLFFDRLASPSFDWLPIRQIATTILFITVWCATARLGYTWAGWARGKRIGNPATTALANFLVGKQTLLGWITLLLALAMLTGALTLGGWSGWTAAGVFLVMTGGVPFYLIDIIRADARLARREIVWYSSKEPYGTSGNQIVLEDGVSIDDAPPIALYITGANWDSIKCATNEDRRLFEERFRIAPCLYRAYGDNTFLQFFDSLKLSRFVVHSGNTASINAFAEALDKDPTTADGSTPISPANSGVAKKRGRRKGTSNTPSDALPPIDVSNMPKFGMYDYTDEPENDEPENDEPENDEPENDEPENDEPENDEPENDGVGLDGVGLDGVGLDGVGLDEPENDEPENDEPENDEPENDEPENDEPENDEPENDGLGNNGVGNDGVGNDGVGNDGVGNDGVGNDGVGNDGVGNNGVGNNGVGNDGLLHFDATGQGDLFFTTKQKNKKNAKKKPS